MDNASRFDPTGDGLHKRLTLAFADLFARNTPYFGGGGPGYYGVHLENITPDGSELDLVLTFRARGKYCCPQLVCHCHFRGAGCWSALREEMDTRGLDGLPLPVIRKARVVIQAGALFDPGSLRRPPLKSKGYSYEDGLFPPVIEPDEG